LQIGKSVLPTVLKGENVIDVPDAASTHVSPATTTMMVSIANNSFLNVSWDCLVMVVLCPLRWVFLSFAARHLRSLSSGNDYEVRSPLGRGKLSLAGIDLETFDIEG
jgi:hypothetical protein